MSFQALSNISALESVNSCHYLMALGNSQLVHHVLVILLRCPIQRHRVVCYWRLFGIFPEAEIMRSMLARRHVDMCLQDIRTIEAECQATA